MFIIQIINISNVKCKIGYIFQYNKNKKKSRPIVENTTNPKNKLSKTVTHNE